MKKKFGPRFRDLAGQTFTRLTPEKVVGKSKNGHLLWKCRCKCNGKTCTVFSTSLLTGNTKSCGCLSKENSAKQGRKRRTHGHAKSGKESPTYRSWASMLQRCTNPNHVYFLLYGGAGITVCDRWLVFKNFLLDLGERPPGTTLGRINDIGGYFPGNVAWMTRAEQEQAKRNKFALLKWEAQRDSTILAQRAA